MRYLLYKTFSHNKMKWLLTTIVFILFAFYNVYRKSLIYNFTIEESLLTSIDDRLMMLILFSILPLFITTSSLNFNSWDAVLISKIRNKNKWAVTNLVCIAIASMCIIFVYYISFFCIGKILGMQNLVSWNDSIFCQLNIINPDSFDALGNPLVGFLNTNTSISTVIISSYFLLVMRTIFFALAVYFICTQSGKFWLGILIVVFFSWFEVYSYSFGDAVNKSVRFFIMPHEHSLTTFINNVHPHIILSIIYWLILLVTLSILCVLYSDRMIEKNMCSYRKNNQEGEYV